MSFKRANSATENLLIKIAGPKHRKFMIIVVRWKKIVGSLLAERAFVCKLNNDILYVAVTNHVWMQELVLQKNMVMQRINQIPEIKINDIIFFIREKPLWLK